MKSLEEIQFKVQAFHHRAPREWVSEGFKKTTPTWLWLKIWALEGPQRLAITWLSGTWAAERLLRTWTLNQCKTPTCRSSAKELQSGPQRKTLQFVNYKSDIQLGICAFFPFRAEYHRLPHRFFSIRHDLPKKSKKMVFLFLIYSVWLSMFNCGDSTRCMVEGKLFEEWKRNRGVGMRGHAA